MGSMEMGQQYTQNPKRKFRWQIAIDGDETTQHYVKTFARPQMDFEETELNFKHEKMWIAGKMTWSSISMTVLDVEQVNPMYDWICSVYQLAAGGDFAMMGKDGDGSYKKNVTLELLDAKGTMTEKWKLEHCWPQSVNFGDLDYSSSDTCDIEVTLRFDRASRL